MATISGGLCPGLRVPRKSSFGEASPEVKGLGSMKSQVCGSRSFPQARRAPRLAGGQAVSPRYSSGLSPQAWQSCPLGFPEAVQSPNVEMAGRLAALHTQLSGGVLSAREEVAGLLVPVLQRQFHSRFAHIDAEIVHDAVVEAIMAYLDEPALFDRTKGLTVRAFVYRNAHQKLCNNIHSAQCRRTRESRWASEQKVQDALALQHSLAEIGAQPELYPLETLQAIASRAAKNGEERQCLSLLLHGETDSCAYAKALGVSGANCVWQRQAVKRVTDRLKARLRRMAARGNHAG
jgi:hypothetical protein